ncbi:hypothetical protein [Hydrogenimonas urashimensis]|uniref:hypothetical protein n=1 Tax=Hydrogenimonas urashimensis TaxID=2740515 RepID=UPI001914EA47|nr:hypothetical protein [Hydrogenimonas urashimensis]
MEKIEREVVQRGIVKAHIRFVKKSDISLAMLCFAFDPAKMSEETLEKAVMIVQENTDFSSLELCEDGTMMTFMKDMHLHRCVQVVKNIQETLRRSHDVEIAYGALTIIDKEDDYESLMHRIRRYLEQSKVGEEGRLCYGTRTYDFCSEGGEEQIFSNFFADNRRITLYNFYNGMPLSEEVKVLSYKNGILRIKTTLARAAFLKNEPFTFFKHPLLPDTVKADVANAVPNRAEVVLTNLRFIDKSPVDRENIRVMPDETIEVFIECANGEEIVGSIHSLAVNSLAIRLDDREMADFCFEGDEKHVVISFDLPERERRKTHFRISAILRYRKANQLIFSIYPNHFFKQKIENYIALQQTRLITIMQKMVLNFYQG